MGFGDRWDFFLSSCRFGLVWSGRRCLVGNLSFGLLDIDFIRGGGIIVIDVMARWSG